MRKLMLMAGLAVAGLMTMASGRSFADEMTWTMKSDYKYRVQVEFYSQSRSHSWPGKGQAWNLNDYNEHEFTISCISGEKICYGAWVTGIGSKYWGVGPDNEHDCESCCGVCGVDNPTMRLVQ